MWHSKHLNTTEDFESKEQSEKRVLGRTSFELGNLQYEIAQLSRWEVWSKGGSRNSAKESKWYKPNPEKTKKLTKSAWTIEWPSGTETWYDLPMKKVIKYMRDLWYTEDKWYNFWIRGDWVKMFGKYVMVAANVDIRPKWTIIKTSLWEWMVCDKCDRAHIPGQKKLVDIAVDWKNNNKQ